MTYASSDLEALISAHSREVHGLLMAITRNQAIAEELTQEVFLKAWKHLGSCPGGDVLVAWLRRLAINVVLDDNRKMRRRFRREAPTPDGVLPERGGNPVSPGLAMDLERAIATLPAGARQVFVLHDVEGFRHAEIGRILGLATGTSKAQLHRARRMLKEALES